jgi:hypothetical protein
MNSMNPTGQKDDESESKSEVPPSAASASMQPAAAASSADAEVEVSNISVMPVVGIMIPKNKKQSITQDQEARHIVLTFPSSQDKSAPWLQSQEGQAGSFFSIHSTIQQPIEYKYAPRAALVQSKCCLCCAYSSGIFEEIWSPYQPGGSHYI